MAALDPHFTDVELMEFLDGELDGARERQLETALASPATAAPLAARLAGLREVGELVRGHLELATDAHEARLRSMWSEIDKQLDLGSAPATSTTPARAPSAAGARRGLLGWFQRYRSHVLTGMVSAGAVAAVAIALRPAPTSERGLVATTLPAAGSAAPTPVAVVPVPVPVSLPRVAPVIESVDVPSGSSMVFTIEDDDGSTAVVWVTPDDTVEGL